MLLNMDNQRELELKEEVLSRFSKKLASNDKKIRGQSLKKLKFFLNRLPDDIPELCLLKLWKGLHYCMWMADKPLFQEQLAMDLSNIMHSFQSKTFAMRFFDAFVQTQVREWHLIDAYRLDKFMMLIRFMFAEVLTLLKKDGWNVEMCKHFCRSLERCFLSKTVFPGLLYHILDVLLVELKRVSSGEHPKHFIDDMNETFIEILSKTTNEGVAKEVKDSYFLVVTKPVYGVDVEALREKFKNTASKNNIKNRSIMYSLSKK